MTKKLDILILILLPILAVFTSLFLKANFLTGTILFYGLPSLYLSWRNRQAIKRALIFALIMSPVGIIADYVAIVDNAWNLPPVEVVPVRLFRVVPMDHLIWGFFVVYVVVIFYEHFLDIGRHNVVDKKFKYLVYIILVLLTMFVATYFVRPDLLNISYVYFKGAAIVAGVPLILFLAHFPRFLAKYAKVVIYFSALNIIYELTALELNQWAFPGVHFIGWVELLNYRLPFEEFFFFVILLSVAILTYFEYFDDNKFKKETRRS